MTAQDLTAAARRALLDVLDALGRHADAFVLVGAQAVYLRTDERALTFSASYTIDADLALDSRLLGGPPQLEAVMTGAGFVLQDTSRPGIWAASPTGNETVTVDFLVPESLAGPGSRGARLGYHGSRVATRAVGLEAALVDHGRLQILDLHDPTRSADVEVAGLSALLVSKLHKLYERIDDGVERRIRPKDAADIYRMLLAMDPASSAVVMRRLLADDLAGGVTATAVRYLSELFGGRRSPGTNLAARALAGDVDETVVRQVCVHTSQVLLELLDHG